MKLCLRMWTENTSYEPVHWKCIETLTENVSVVFEVPEQRQRGWEVMGNEEGGANWSSSHTHTNLLFPSAFVQILLSKCVLFKYDCVSVIREVSSFCPDPHTQTIAHYSTRTQTHIQELWGRLPRRRADVSTEGVNLMIFFFWRVNIHFHSENNRCRSPGYESLRRESLSDAAGPEKAEVISHWTGKILNRDQNTAATQSFPSTLR